MSYNYNHFTNVNYFFFSVSELKPRVPDLWELVPYVKFIRLIIYERRKLPNRFGYLAK